MRARGLLLAIALAAVFAAPASPHPARVELVARGDVPATAMTRLAREADDAAARVDTWLGIDASAVTLRCEVYPTLEAKGLATGYTLPTHAFPAQGLVVCAAEDGFEGELGREVAAALIMRVLGRSACDFLEEGLAVACARGWRGKGCRYWAARLASYQDVGDLGHWLDNQSYRAESPLVRRAVAGEFVTRLVEVRGAVPLVKAFASWAPWGATRAALEQEWRAHLGELRRQRARSSGKRHPLPHYVRGFCHAHEGYSIRDGYLSGESDRSLAALRELGVNGVSLTPFTFLRAAGRPARFPFSSGAGAENDESVIHASLVARRAGMTVMLKPHVWVGGGWPGEVAFDSAAEWDAFFAHYERWIRHYALLAEMYDLDLFCAGVELTRATVGHEARWIDMVGRLRTVYHGRITYAANWGGEFENVTFWKAFDYIGLDCYYPLDPGEAAGDAELERGARAVLDRVEKVAAAYRRPVLITEFGFASTPSPWRSPHDESAAPGVDLAAQARCYDAFLGALPGRERIAGVYAWKWPSVLGEGGRSHAGFTPAGKPAEQVIRRWYRGALAR